MAPQGVLSPHMQAIHREVIATPAGSEYTAVVLQHAPEVRTLVTTNRRVGAVWKRNGGAEIVQSLREHAEAGDDELLPDTIAGKPRAHCLARIAQALMRFGSPALVADLRKYGPILLGFAELPYPQILARLQAEGHA
jgi:hypothetical protein